MKKIYTILFIGVLAFAACTPNPEATGPNTDIAITIAPPPAFAAHTSDPTRAAADPATGKTVWAAGDEITLTITYRNAAGEAEGSDQTLTARLTATAPETWTIVAGAAAWPANPRVITADITARYDAGTADTPVFETEVTAVSYGTPIYIRFDRAAHRSIAIAFSGFAASQTITIANHTAAGETAADGTRTLYLTPTTDDGGTISGTVGTLPFSVALATKPLGKIYPVTPPTPGTGGPAQAAEAARFLKWADDVRSGALPINSGFTLTEDIDISHAGVWKPIYSYASGNPYRGTFDGGRHTISGLRIDAASHDQGLFGYASGATIANLTLFNPQVANTGSDYTGALVGYAVNCTISNCHVVGGTITAGNETGGLTGHAIGSNIVNCSASAAVTGGNYVGGLVGYVGSTTKIVACRATGSVTATESAGGLVGWVETDPYIYFSYSTGDINAGSGMRIGGLVGTNAGGIIYSCYATGDVVSTAITNIGSLVGADAGAVMYCYGGGKPTGTLIGNYSIYPTNTASAAEALATLRHNDVPTITARMWSGANVVTYRFTKAVWNDDFSLDVNNAGAMVVVP